MKTIKAQPLSVEAFAPYGTYVDTLHPKGFSIGGEFSQFYPDFARMTTKPGEELAFSVSHIKYMDKKVVDNVEYHTHTGEALLPMDGDMLLHVAPPTKGVPRPDLTEAFLVPKGTVVILKTAAWHGAPLAAQPGEMNVMILLPERVYMNDCIVHQLEEKDQFIVEG